MQPQSFYGKMAEYFVELSRLLSTFLDSNLPLCSENWWHNLVLKSLTQEQLARVQRESISSLKELDLAALLRICRENWSQISQIKNLPIQGRNFLFEMQNVRNRWSHANVIPLDPDDIYRDLDTVQRFAQTINANQDFIDKIKQDKKTILSTIYNPPSITEKVEIQKSKTIDEELKILEENQFIKDISSFVTIKGVQIPTVRTGNQSEPYFKTVIPLLLQALDSEEVEKLQTVYYCKNFVKIGSNVHPLLSKNKNEMYDKTGRFRAYKNMISNFWVYAQWGKHNLPEWADYLCSLEVKYRNERDIKPVSLETLTSQEIKSTPRAERAFVLIKGIKIYTEREENNSRAYFEDIIPKLLKVLPDSEIKNLQDKIYCCDKIETGIIQHPILSKNKTEMIDKTGRLRAYSKQIEGYWVSAQWNENNLKAWRKYLQLLEHLLG